jgi:hypothetical protein
MSPLGDPLGIYLNDHLSGATLAVELARRAQRSNEGTSYGDFLERLSAEIEEDRAELEVLMSRLGVGKDRLKLGAAWAAEKVGRLKLNGQLRGYAPLSRVVELEGLMAGVEGKLALWRGLRELAEGKRGVDQDSLARLIERAQRQLRGLRRQHQRAVAEALAERR